VVPQVSPTSALQAATLAYTMVTHMVFGITAAVLAYVVLARLLFGTTAGERVGQVSYRSVGS
jgi:hypothetical protein